MVCSASDLYPAGGPFAATPVVALAGHAVNAIVHAAGGAWWLATDVGAGVLEGDVFTLSALQGVEVLAVFADHEEAIFFGTALGLFLHQSLGDRWHYYAGTDADRAGRGLAAVHPRIAAGREPGCAAGGARHLSQQRRFALAGHCQWDRPLSCAIRTGAYL